MALTLGEIAELLSGRLEGDGTAEVSGVASLGEAQPGDVSFLANPRYGSDMDGTAASAVLVREDWSGACPSALIRVPDPDAAFARLVEHLVPPPVEPAAGVHPAAVLADDVFLGEDVRIGACCVIGSGVRIGPGTWIEAGCVIGHDTVIGAGGRIYPHVSIREHTRIGDRVILHNGTVIGSDGFGYTRQDGQWHKIRQVGTVEIGDDVEIGANAAVDRARFGRTVIGNGVKLDNLVHVAHNVRIGDHTAVAGQSGIAGSTRVGACVELAGQVGIGGHIEIGDRCVVGGKSAVIKSVPPDSFVVGFPAEPFNRWRREQANVRRLPELRKRVAELEARVEELTRQTGSGGKG